VVVKMSLSPNRLAPKDEPSFLGIEPAPIRLRDGV
jgi:hypothetical protein